MRRQVRAVNARRANEAVREEALRKVDGDKSRLCIEDEHTVWIGRKRCVMAMPARMARTCRDLRHDR
ncbi:hypothetical protein [Luteipulveratus mongoliensis]|uniref:Uncharacterized protein n=1 Tax=Luteipulveratus mongoliensis TaxID=571913 RepID=A0A0K1JJ22_9MICO|nr:hypothetical protein [Luteipulveratus mongoliensis]AKU16595.1 hypothetical protein VV02_13205 [Luteipulveratus mongoliensis]